MVFVPYKMLDTSNPGTATLPKGYQAVAGYIGGDTPHVWTDAQWKQFPKVPKLPIFVRSTAGDRKQGESDGWSALELLFALGVKPGKAVAYDIETDTSISKVVGFRSVLEWFGYNVWVYGSRDFVFKVPALNYWVADYTGSPHWLTRNSRATQYEANVLINGVRWDVSNVRRWQIRSGQLWT